MHVRSSYDYAIVRVVPRVERGEFVNAGVILFCRTRRFLGARIAHVPVRTIYNDEKSHFRPLIDTLRIALAAIQFKVEDGNS